MNSEPTRALSPQLEARLEILDSLRGFALFGILCANLGVFSAFLFLTPEQKDGLPNSGADHGLTFLVHMLAEGKFYSLFSFLFGLGFALQWQSAANAGRRFAPTYLRRMAGLLAIGAAHAAIWVGDILVLYALMGCVLALYRNVGPRVLLGWAVFWIFSPVAWYGVMLATGGGVNPARALFVLGGALSERLGADTLSAATLTGSAGEVFRANLASLPGRFGDFVYTNRFGKVLGMFLAGVWCARSGVLFDDALRRRWARRGLRAFLPLGLVGNLVLAVLMERGGWYPLSVMGLAQTAAYAVGVAPLAVAYASGFALLWDRPRARRCLAPLSAAGRMALSNYLAQTAFGILAFNGWALGLGGRVGPSRYLVLGCGFFALQVVASRWWLRRFHFGPCEWMWRRFTYGRAVPMRIRP